MSLLTIRHVTGSDPPAFQVVHEDGRAAGPFVVEPPSSRRVEGRPTTDLLVELRWYLEQFLDYPFEPETYHAERVLQALGQWGRDAFDALFDSRQTGSWFEDAIKAGLEQLSIRVTSDDPSVLGWPWETLEDKQSGTVAQTCRLERRLDELPSLVELPTLPNDKVNVLLIVARPYEADVRFGSIARPLIELVESKRLPVDITLLRPPTFAQLEQQFRARPGYYHLVHFDGHGGYGAVAVTPDRHKYLAEGLLIFEDDQGQEDPVKAETLSTLLREHRIPAVVLNACRSAMVDEQAANQFASVATSLLKAGIRNVVAMSHVLYVSAAQEFLPAFYERLFETGAFDEAVRAGRRRLLKEKGRVCARGRFDLEDWLVPVVYAQGAEELSFAATGTRAETTALPEAVTDQENPYGFIGRDGALLQLERAMRRPPGVLLVTGLGGVGKTTLAAGFVEWLLRTDGLKPEELFWFRFDEINNAEYVLNRIGERFFGNQIATIDVERKLPAIVKALKEQRCLVVWDNFESVHGIEGTGLAAKLPQGDRDLLARLARDLRGGASKILLTSRSPEAWLEKRHRFPLTLGGLVGEERWELCETIVRDQGLAVDRENPALKELLDLLDGHPLAMRVVLPELDKGHPAESVLKRLQDDVGLFARAELDETERKLFATLRFATEQLPEELQPLLVPLELHERFVDADILQRMAQGIDADRWSRARIDTCLRSLSSAGLVQDRGQALFELHPLLTRYLATCFEPDDAWTQAFVGFYGRFADQLAPKPLHEQKGPFHFHGENMHTARREAERLGMEVDYGALTQCLAMYAQNTHDYAEAERLFTEYAESGLRQGREDLVAGAYHQLGMISQEQRAFDDAERWYHKSLEITERLGDEQDAAITYHQLGIIAQERHAFDDAEQWYRKSLEIKERLGNEQGAASTYHNLGRIAEERRAFDDAERLYCKSLEINERLGNEQGAASTYHNLGMIAEERRAFDDAERWYHKSLEIAERLGNEQGAAGTYHQLGIIAEERRAFDDAERWYHKAVEVFEKLGIEHHAAISYHQLGMIAEQRRAFDDAERWYLKSLEIEERLGNEQGAATTYHQLGIISQKRRAFDDAEQWYHKSLEIEERLGDEHGAASTYGQLGIVAAQREDFLAVARWLAKSVQAFHDTGDEHGAHVNAGNFAIVYRQAPRGERDEMRRIWTEAGHHWSDDFDETPNEE